MLVIWCLQSSAYAFSPPHKGLVTCNTNTCTHKRQSLYKVSAHKKINYMWRNNCKTMCAIHNITLNAMTRYKNINGHMNGHNKSFSHQSESRIPNESNHIWPTAYILCFLTTYKFILVLQYTNNTTVLTRKEDHRSSNGALSVLNKVWTGIM